MTGNKFTHRCGERPLDGFTIKRGVGRGGFGEVYLAVSDGGKEVALKLLGDRSETELRGIGYCLNIKHPNLVHLYDLRTDSRGKYWVVMEYVFGDSLAQLIDRHPNGLPLELVREWFPALARGVAYLHDRGVIHRDLKPANIFVEQGTLKIGDYGLSRRLSDSAIANLTLGIGTPYYMAPEIRKGGYGASVDIYACGVILYEMLTGRRPFEGHSPEEILIRHQCDKPDLKPLPEALQPVLARALEKEPSKRYPSVLELARAVEAAIDETLKGNPKIGVTTNADPDKIRHLAAASTIVDVGLPRPRPVQPSQPGGSESSTTVPNRAVELLGGLLLAPVVCAACTLPWALLQSDAPWWLLGRIFLTATIFSWALLVAGLLPARDEAHQLALRVVHFVIGAAVGMLVFWLDGWALPSDPSTATARDVVLWTGHRLTPEALSAGIRYLAYFGLVAAVVRWWQLTDRRRRERIRLAPVIGACAWAAVFLLLWPWESAHVLLGLAPVGIAAVSVQVVAPWSTPPSRERD